jgi:hypothetical protein
MLIGITAITADGVAKLLSKDERGGGRRFVLGGGHASKGVKRYSDQHHDPGLRGNSADRIAIHIIEPHPAHRYEDARPQQKPSRAIASSLPQQCSKPTFVANADIPSSRSFPQMNSFSFAKLVFPK